MENSTINVKEKIRINNFTKKYGSFKAADSMNVSIYEGSITGLVGKNGAGKTTVMRAMANSILPTEGEIHIGGLHSVKEAKKIRSFMSYMSGRDNIYRNIRVIDALEFCAKDPKRDRTKALELCDYFELNVTKKTNQLSLGNKKKLAIIQSMMKSSQVYIFDEPTNGLDPFMQDKFFKLLQREKERGATILLSSHNLSELDKYCDRVLILKAGKIVEDINMIEARKELKLLVTYETDKPYSKVYDGDINVLIENLSYLELKNLEIKKLPIEERFMEYYGGIK